MSSRNAPIHPPLTAERYAAHMLEQDVPRARSLVVTVFGDAIGPHGGEVWLSGLIRLMQHLGLNERLVRTSVFRLAEEGWIVARKFGRRSRYGLSPEGRQRFDRAYRQVYATPPDGGDGGGDAGWDGRWRLVFLPSLAAGGDERADMRRELEWSGYRMLAPGVLCRPLVPEIDPLTAPAPLQADLDMAIVDAHDAALPSGTPLARWALPLWDLHTVANRYQAFVTRFSPLEGLIDPIADIPPDLAFRLRTLLIHAHRRVSLHDPQLPAVLLPDPWPGDAARRLCARLYRQLLPRSEQWLEDILQDAEIGWPAADDSLARRFATPA